MRLPRLALTPGEPAGIGPDLMVQLAQEALPAELVVISDPGLLEARARQLGLPLAAYPSMPTPRHSRTRPGACASSRLRSGQRCAAAKVIRRKRPMCLRH